MSSLRAYLELGRVSNIGTVWTNVMVGCLLGATDGAASIPLVGLAMSLLYVGGMAMNDLVDASHDRATRSDRPIPSGRITEPAALRFTLLTMVAGLGLMLPTGLPAVLATLILIACIVGYNLLHKRTVLAAGLMGACRSAVIVASGLAVGMATLEIAVWAPALVMWVYVTLLTIGASREERAGPDTRRRAFWVLPVVPLLILLAGVPASPLSFLMAAATVAALLGAAFWQASRPGSHPATVILTSLAAICLVDATSLAWGGVSPGVPMTIAVLTMLAHRKILGT